MNSTWHRYKYEQERRKPPSVRVLCWDNLRLSYRFSIGKPSKIHLKPRKKNIPVKNPNRGRFLFFVDSLFRFIDSILWFDSLFRFIDSIHWFDSLVRFLVSILWFDSLIRFFESIFRLDSLIRSKIVRKHWFSCVFGYTCCFLSVFYCVFAHTCAENIIKLVKKLYLRLKSCIFTENPYARMHKTQKH